MARSRKTRPAEVDVAHLISAGVLASVCSRALIEEVLADTGKASQRERLLPAPAVECCATALVPWREAPLEEVRRVVCEGLLWLAGGQVGVVQASLPVQRWLADDCYFSTVFDSADRAGCQGKSCG